MMKKILGILIFLLLLMPIFTVGPVKAEGLKEIMTKEFLFPDKDAWVPLDIELPALIGGFANNMARHGTEAKGKLMVPGIKMRNTARLYAGNVWGYNTYIVAELEKFYVQEVHVYLPFNTVDERDNAIEDVWTKFVNYDNNLMFTRQWAFFDPWIGIEFYHPDYTLRMLANKEVEIHDCGPWAIRLSKVSLKA